MHRNCAVYLEKMKSYLGPASCLAFVSFVMLISFFGYVTSHLNEARLFSFGWTHRMKLGNSAQNITTTYYENLDTSHAHLEDMLHKTMETAYCKPVDYGGHLTWKADDVSGLCQCLRNAHYEYTKAVCSQQADNSCISQKSMESEKASFYFHLFFWHIHSSLGIYT